MRRLHERVPGTLGVRLDPCEIVRTCGPKRWPLVTGLELLERLSYAHQARHVLDRDLLAPEILDETRIALSQQLREHCLSLRCLVLPGRLYR